MLYDGFKLSITCIKPTKPVILKKIPPIAFPIKYEMKKNRSIEVLIKNALKSTKIQDESVYFIALIHPIQWTNAYPVGADRPAKRQKKTSCVSTGQAGPVLCTRQVACSTSFLSRQSDVIASFSFGACAVYTNFFSELISNLFINMIQSVFL